MIKSAAIVMVALVWMGLRLGGGDVFRARAVLSAAKSADEVQASLVDDACERTGEGWYFLGPDKLIGFSDDSCAAAFEAWRRTTYPRARLVSL